MSAYTTSSIVAVTDIDLELSPISPISPVSPPLSPYAAAFVPARRQDDAQRPLSPEAPDFVPEIKKPDSPMSPHAAVHVPMESTPTPVERLLLVPVPLPTSSWLLSRMEHCERSIMHRIDVLEKLEQLPTYLGPKHGQHLMEGMVAYEDIENKCNAIGKSLKYLIALYKFYKAQLDAGLWEDVGQEWPIAEE